MLCVRRERPQRLRMNEYAMESAQLSSSQLTRINHVHFKSIRRSFGSKSYFYHRVLNPTPDCSNEYLSGLAKDTLRRRVVCPSQIHSQNRLALLGMFLDMMIP